MAKKQPKVIITLTEDQYAQLKPLLDHAWKKADAHKGGIILGQPSPYLADRRCAFEFVPFKKAVAVIGIVHPEEHKINIEYGMYNESDIIP